MNHNDITEDARKTGNALNDVKNKIIEERHMANIAELFKILGDTTRVSILAALAVSERCVGDIATLLNMSNSAISHQLRVLKQTHIVKNRREGKTVYYRMADNHIMQLLSTALEHSSEEQGGRK